MERNFHYRIINVPNTRIRGFIPIRAAANPTQFKLSEVCKKGNPSSLAILWDTMLKVLNPSEDTSENATKIDLDNLTCHYKTKKSETCIIISHPNGQVLENPHQLFEDILARFTINLLEFLELAPEQRAKQFKALKKKLADTKDTESLSYFTTPLTSQNSLHELLFHEIDFNKRDAIEKISFSLAMALSANPRHKIIRITHRQLLNPSYLDRILTMAEMGDHQVWIATETHHKVISTK